MVGRDYGWAGLWDYGWAGLWHLPFVLSSSLVKNAPWLFLTPL